MWSVQLQLNLGEGDFSLPPVKLKLDTPKFFLSSNSKRKSTNAKRRD
jgi:hypothetical protein